MTAEADDFRETIDHQLLDAMGVPPEKRSEVAALRREIRELREQEREATRRNLEALAKFYVETVAALPEGCTLHVEFS